MARPSLPAADRLHGQPEDGSGYMSVAVVGIDLGKNSCSLAVLDPSGAVIQRRRMRPGNIELFTKKLPACTRCFFRSAIHSSRETIGLCCMGETPGLPAINPGMTALG